MPISWGPSFPPYDTGDSNAVALDDQGDVVEVHVGSGRLFSRVGTADFISDLGSITWGPSVEYDTGGPNAVALWKDPGGAGYVAEVHVGSGRLFYRLGAAAGLDQRIPLSPSVEYDTGGPNAVARDNQGHVVEVHVGSGRLFYRVGHFTSQCSGAAFS
jgi:hypothetical protein